MLSARLRSAWQLSRVFSCFFSRGGITLKCYPPDETWFETGPGYSQHWHYLLMLCCPFEQDVVMTHFRSNMFKESFTGWVLLYQWDLAIKACLSDWSARFIKYFSQIQSGAFVFICAGKHWVGIYSELCNVILFFIYIYIILILLFFITLQIDQKAWQSRLYEDVLTPYVKVLFQTRYSRLFIAILLVQQIMHNDSFITCSDLLVQQIMHSSSFITADYA